MVTTITSSSEASFEFEALRRDIWAAANALRSAGLNPLETVEHVSLLMLFRLAERSDGGTLGDLRRLSTTLDSAKLHEEAASHEHPARFFSEEFYPALRSALDERQPDSPLRLVLDGFTPRVADDQALLRALDIIERMSLSVERVDVNGALYEKLVGTISDAGFLGQYFTPRHIVDAMVELVRPSSGETIYDPAAGTGGFLIGAATEELRTDASRRPALFGREINAAARRLCIINLIIHGLDPSHIEPGDSLAADSQVEDAYDVILTNPPFGQTIAAADVTSRFPVPSRSAEALFVQHVVRALKPGGRAAIVCPEGLLTNVGTTREVRQWLIERADIEMVMSLPGGVFLPYTGVRTGVLVLTKGRPTRRVWFFDVRTDGYSLDPKRRATGESDLPAAVAGFSRRVRTDKSQSLSLAQLAKHDLRLVASRYLNGRKARSTLHPLVPLAKLASYRRSALDPSSFPDDEFFYVGLEHIESRTGDLLNVDVVAGASLKSQKSRFCAGDVLYGKLRPYLAKAALAPSDGICSTEILVLMADEENIVADYLAHVLRSAPLTEEATALMVGANHPRLHPRDLMRIQIPVPTLEEQRELVAEANELRAKIDDAARAIESLRNELVNRVEAVWGS